MENKTLKTKGHWSFKTDITDFRTGKKAGRCKHYVWAQEINGQRILRVEKRIVEKAQGEEEYIRVLNGIGFRVEPIAIKFDTLFAYCDAAFRAGKEFDVNNRERESEQGK